MSGATTGDALAEAALAFAGTRFRLHGRTRETGLDCVGLLDAALRGIGAAPHLPNGYPLRSLTQPDVETWMHASGFVPAEAPRQPGDVLILRPAPTQVHVAIALAPQRIVHAHAGLRKVVVTPLPDPWPVLSRWRLLPPSLT
ncbi:C40 family peptidase [Novosphingobium sp. 9]|uniref:C40 family peptidase n=1 Tax=Novosphingobium sp. 9 TaxID=2025349 RepID=UPI0021B6C9E5|nr:C40 family peptidase [Novosphingobium sp. 9]